MFFLIFVTLGGIFVAVQYFQAMLQEQRHMQRRFEKLTFGTYEILLRSRADKRSNLLKTEVKVKITAKQLRYLSIASMIVAYFIYDMVSKIIGIPLLILAIGFNVATFMYGVRKTRRITRIQRDLPGAIDLMVICLAAGLGISASFERVSREMEGSVLGDEFRRMVNESNSGMPLEEALRNFAARLDLPEVSGIVGPIIQAHKSGASISETFQIQAESLREKMKLQVKEKMLRVPVLVLFPMLVFIMPVIFILVLGPALVSMRTSGLT